MKVRWFSVSMFLAVCCSVAEAQNMNPNKNNRTKSVNPVPLLPPETYLLYGLDKPSPPLLNWVRTKTESFPIQTLRKKAQELVDSMKRYIATYRQFPVIISDGKKLEGKSHAWEIRMVDGKQIFRDSHGKETDKVPCPESPGLNAGGEWSELPKMVSTDLKLRMQQVSDITLLEGTFKVFRYQAAQEDENGTFLSCADDSHAKPQLFVVAVRGEVWTDKEFNILRMTQDLIVPEETRWQHVRTSVLYGWLDSSSSERKLVPIYSLIIGENFGQVYMSMGSFTAYHQFEATVRLDMSPQ